MKRYEAGDTVTMYFVIYDDKKKNKQWIQAWSDDKDMIDAYMKFHNTSALRIRKIVGRLDEIVSILNECVNDEINIGSLRVRDPKNKYKVKWVYVPITLTESQLLRSDGSSHHLGTFINLEYMSAVIPYLKREYQTALKKIYMCDMISSLYGHDGEELMSIDVDDIALFMRALPDLFG